MAASSNIPDVSDLSINDDSIDGISDDIVQYISDDTWPVETVKLRFYPSVIGAIKKVENCPLNESDLKKLLNCSFDGRRRGEATAHVRGLNDNVKSVYEQLNRLHENLLQFNHYERESAKATRLRIKKIVKDLENYSSSQKLTSWNGQIHYTPCNSADQALDRSGRNGPLQRFGLQNLIFYGFSGFLSKFGIENFEDRLREINVSRKDMIQQLIGLSNLIANYEEIEQKEYDLIVKRVEAAIRNLCNENDYEEVHPEKEKYPKLIQQNPEFNSLFLIRNNM